MDTAFIARKSLHATTDIETGTALTTDHIEISRPANGLQPGRYEQILGRRLSESLTSGDPITDEVLTK
jgi:N-acetylneuraminate synthase/N,N'-diacetyllegionaminate synthase